MKTSSSTSLKVKSLNPKAKKPSAIKLKKPTKAKAKTKYAHAELEHSHAPILPTAVKTKPILKRNPLGHLLIEKMLREAGFRGGISSDKRVLEKYSTDESIFQINPQVVIQPKNRTDLEIATKVVARETKRFTSLSLTPRAAGTGLSGGSLSDSIVVDVVPHLHKIGEVTETKDGALITCEPGAMWREVEKKLKRHGTYIPSYTSSKDICTIGGSVANNAAGPDSLRYGHCADWVESLEVVFNDGHTYTVAPLTYKQFKSLTKEKHEYARITREIFALLEKNEKELLKAKPKTPKNTAGYALWHICPQGVAAFKKGKGTFDLTRLISGSQGTIGIIAGLTMRAIPIPQNTSLVVLPLFTLDESAKAILAALEYNPINVEIFDSLTFDLALKNPDFFKKRLVGMDYYKTLLAMYTTYHIRLGRKTPEFTILATFDEETTSETPAEDIARAMSVAGAKARVVRNPHEVEMYLQIRRASFSLSKMIDPDKRPAAFLEDMTVPPENLGKFFVEIKKMLK